MNKFPKEKNVMEYFRREEVDSFTVMAAEKKDDKNIWLFATPVSGVGNTVIIQINSTGHSDIFKKISERMSEIEERNKSRGRNGSYIIIRKMSAKGSSSEDYNGMPIILPNRSLTVDS